MRRLAIACVVLAACSHIFGLDGVPADDRDGDHWPDAIDNCPNDFNPDQSDVDGNGVGDRCQLCESPSGLDDDGDGIPNECDGCDDRLPDNNHDGVPDACEHLNDAGMIVIPQPDAACPLCMACTLGPPHDEDGDALADACDDCPIFASLIETGDADGDGVGDLCDVSLNPSYQIFDAFAEPNQNWLQIGVWTVTHDQLHVFPNLGPAYRQLGTAVSHFAIRTRMIAAGGTNGDVNAGVMAARDANLDASNAAETVQCGIHAAFGSTSGAVLVLHPVDASAPTNDQALPLPPAANYRIELAYSAMMKQITCTAFPAGTGQAVQLMAPENNPSTMTWTTGFYAVAGGGSADFDFFQMASDR